MAVIGDDTPDDAWQADDPPLIRLAVLVRRLEYERARLELQHSGGLPPVLEDRRRLLEVLADLGRLVADLLSA